MCNAGEARLSSSNKVNTVSVEQQQQTCDQRAVNVKAGGGAERKGFPTKPCTGGLVQDGEELAPLSHTSTRIQKHLVAKKSLEAASSPQHNKPQVHVISKLEAV